MKSTPTNLIDDKDMAQGRAFRRFSSGFSLVELLLVIGIASSVSIGVFLAYPKFNEVRQAGRVAESHINILAGVRQYYAGDPPIGINAGVMVGAGILEPNELQTDWGGTVSLEYFLGKVRIGYDQLTPGLCSEILANMEHYAPDISIGNTILKSDSTPFSFEAGAMRCDTITKTERLWFGDEL